LVSPPLGFRQENRQSIESAKKGKKNEHRHVLYKMQGIGPERAFTMAHVALACTASDTTMLTCLGEERSGRVGVEHFLLDCLLHRLDDIILVEKMHL
jgi:hypothetical protein